LNHLGIILAAAVTCAPQALAQVGPDGIDWVTVGAPGNRAYDREDPFNLVAGRGAVDYEYRLGRTEVTTAQWMEFFNAASARADPPPLGALLNRPILWGAQVDPTYTGPGTRYRLDPNIPNAAMLAVSGVSWRQAAVLCNWLHNDKSSAPSAFLSGAYDVSTFSGNFPTFTDQPARSPGARYFMPTLDEWMKGVHYDPNADNGAGRWWLQPNGTDTPLTYGPPPSFGGDGSGMANAGFTLSGSLQYRIPLGAYPGVQTPWGLLDASGATSEWLESIRVVDGNMTRGVEGAFWGSTGLTGADFAYSWGQDSPGSRSVLLGLRLGSVVPAPASGVVVVVACGVLPRRRRRPCSNCAFCP
jgi:sulfatase modifying factor 1